MEGLPFYVRVTDASMVNVMTQSGDHQGQDLQTGENGLKYKQEKTEKK